MRLTRKQPNVTGTMKRALGIVTESRRGIGSHGRTKRTIGKNQPSKKQVYYWSSYDKNRGRMPKQAR